MLSSSRQHPSATVILVVALAVVVACLAPAPCGHASECLDNNWQPTYVHDLIAPDGPYYVLPDGRFVQLTGDWTNQSGPGMCCLYGVRDARGFTTCQEYTRVQCGCGASSWGNSTCAAFLTMKGYARPGGGQGQSQSWNECETSDREVCGTWTWDQAQGAFVASWQNGATAIIRVESNSGGQIVLNRYETAPQAAGFTARYVGTWNGNVVSGQVTWSWQGQSWSGSWRATVSVPTSQPAQPQSADPCDQECDRFCRGAGASGGRIGQQGLCLLGVVSDPAQACSCW
jgi:hypothetical protein